MTDAEIIETFSKGATASELVRRLKRPPAEIGGVLIKSGVAYQNARGRIMRRVPIDKAPPEPWHDVRAKADHVKVRVGGANAAAFAKLLEEVLQRG